MNLRELKRAERRIEALLEQVQMARIDLLSYRNELKSDIHMKRASSSDLDLLLEVVSYYFKVDPKVVKEYNRKNRMPEIRQIFCYIALSTVNPTYKALGIFLNGRDHSSIVYSVKRVKDLRDTEDRFAFNLDICESLCEDALRIGYLDVAEFDLSLARAKEIRQVAQHDEKKSNTVPQRESTKKESFTVGEAAKRLRITKDRLLHLKEPRQSESKQWYLLSDITRIKRLLESNQIAA